MPRKAIFAAIEEERSYQDRKYGPVLVDPANHTGQGPGGHELGAWCLVLRKELHEAEDAVIHGGFQHARGRNSVRAELVQIAAVAVAALEQHGLEEDDS